MGPYLEGGVREATSGDEQGLFTLAKGLATSFVPTTSRFGETFQRLLSDQDAVILVALAGGGVEPIGYLLGFRHDTFYADGPVGWVEEIYTHPGRRRTGVAAALMRECESWAWQNGARLVALATRRASSFYEAIGYEDSAAYFRKLAPD